jgi:hypothetical protein
VEGVEGVIIMVEVEVPVGFFVLQFKCLLGLFFLQLLEPVEREELVIRYLDLGAEEILY